MSEFRYFTDAEFSRATPGCSLSEMNVRFMNRLETARAYAGVPFIINSAYRSPWYEQSQGRSGTSSHCKGLAVDIRCDSSDRRLILIMSLLRAGFRRIGIAQTYIHVDSDTTKPQCIWLYD